MVLIKNRSTPDNVAFWNNVEEVATKVRKERGQQMSDGSSDYQRNMGLFQRNREQESKPTVPAIHKCSASVACKAILDLWRQHRPTLDAYSQGEENGLNRAAEIAMGGIGKVEKATAPTVRPCCEAAAAEWIPDQIWVPSAPSVRKEAQKQLDRRREALAKIVSRHCHAEQDDKVQVLVKAATKAMLLIDADVTAVTFTDEAEKVTKELRRALAALEVR